MDRPSQEANTKADALDAAFERARRKLAGARDVIEARRGPLISTAAVLRWLKVAIFLCLLVALPLWAMQPVPKPSLWLQDPSFPLLCAVWVGMAVLLVRVYLRIKRMHPAEKVLRDFYAEVYSESKIRRLEEFVISDDFDGQPRKTPPFEITRELLPPTNGPELDSYWTTLRNPTGKGFYKANIRSLTWQEIAPDLRLAYVKVRLSRQTTLMHFAWMIPLFAVFIITKNHAIKDHLDAPYEQWATIGIWGLFFVVFTAMLWLLQQFGTTYRVRKLLVRSGKQWRLFCGDWEGWDERDLSWLDFPTPQTTKT
jgi:hypothetical protein